MTQAITQIETDDNGNELRINDDATPTAEIEAQHIHEAVSAHVTVQKKDHKDENRIAVYWNDSMDVEDVNSFHKAGIIQRVLDSKASVELHTTRDGDKAVVFKPN